MKVMCKDGGCDEHTSGDRDQCCISCDNYMKDMNDCKLAPSYSCSQMPDHSPSVCDHRDEVKEDTDFIIEKKESKLSQVNALLDRAISSMYSYDPSLADHYKMLRDKINE